jgi:hypothetical protein
MDVEAKPSEIRARIEEIPDVLVIKRPQWSLKIDGVKLRSLDKYLLSSASRISEAVMEPVKGGSLNTGLDLALSFGELNGEEAAIFELKTLKRKDHVVRSVALPMNPRFEPWTRDIVEAWSEGNPWTLNRDEAWAGNREVFAGLRYQANHGGSIALKPVSNHGLRHIRTKELIQLYGFSPVEVQRFLGWTAGSLRSQGVNPMMDVYFSLVWRDYFPRLLKSR